MRKIGDEFLVIAQGLAHDSVEQRIRTLRTTLASAGAVLPQITFDAGFDALAPGALPDQAIAAADPAMYAATERARRHGALGR